MSSDLLTEIEAFLTETGMHEQRFGFLAVKNRKLVDRLRKGVTPQGKRHRIWPETEMEVRAFIRAERQRRKVAA